MIVRAVGMCWRVCAAVSYVAGGVWPVGMYVRWVRTYVAGSVWPVAMCVRTLLGAYGRWLYVCGGCVRAVVACVLLCVWSLCGASDN